MNEAVRDCLVSGYESLENGLELPDPEDRHVLAAAIKAGAQTIVSHNLKHFPEAALAPFGVQAQHPDLFAMGLLELNSRIVLEVLDNQGAALHSPRTGADVLATLETNGLGQFVEYVRQQGWA